MADEQGVDEGVCGVGDAVAFAVEFGRLKKLTENYVVSNEKIKRALGIERMPVTADGGVEEDDKIVY